MRRIIELKNNWTFTKSNKSETISLPHTYNNIDGQDGGGDYYRGKVKYQYLLNEIFNLDQEEIYLEFKGVNSSCKVFFNGQLITTHDGGYSTFRVNITSYIKDTNEIVVEVDNAENDYVYPQKADFTFYGGIYRQVNLIIVNKEDHFDLDFYGSNGLKIVSAIENKNASITVDAFTKSSKEVIIEILDQNKNLVKQFKNHTTASIENVHLWNGLNDPYLYTIKAKLIDNDTILDEIACEYGFRSFTFDARKGFFLNGKLYPLRGVSRHQDRLGLGNALERIHHEEDINMILEMGANTVRLAHYQQDDYVYELCDRTGLIVWAEIPYISQHLTNGKDNAIQQLKELIYQQFNHPSIAVWGISNEITMFKTNKKELLEFHRYLNNLCHEIDSSRKTVLACFAMCSPFNKISYITDIVSWNLYLGWYVPGLFLNDLWISFYHLVHPHRVIGYSEYGAEGMPNLHSEKPKIGDNSEEYQCKYHEYLLECFNRHPYLWGTHVWNMFDFGSDGRDQGGDPGKNHKGLVTFDRKIKKDSFYLYKAYWSKESVLHLCSKRFINRNTRKTTITIYTNQNEVSLYNNDKLIKTFKNKKVIHYKLTLEKENHLKVISNNLQDEMFIRKVEQKDLSYENHTGNSHSWEKKK